MIIPLAMIICFTNIKHMLCFWCSVSVTFFFFFYFPTVQQGGQVILTCIHYNYIFPPPFVLLQHEYLDIVLNAIQHILTILILPIQEHDISFQLRYLWFLSPSVLWFSEYRCFVSLDRFIPRYFILFDVMVNGIS